MAKLFNVENFLKLSSEEQARAIEKQTKELIRRLPTLKKQLKMYGEVSDELYNLTEEEVNLMGTTYAKAVRGGEISTPSSKRAYNKFISNLRKYTRTSISQLATMTAEQRMDSWLDTIREHASKAEIEYAEELVMGMTDKQKLGFTRSEYFINNENWNSKDSFIKHTDNGEYSIQTLKLELYLETYENNQTEKKYNTNVATDGQDKLRGAYRGRKPTRRKL